MNPLARALAYQAKEKPDHWVGGREVGSFRLDVRWSAPVLLLSLKTTRHERSEGQARRDAWEAFQGLGIGKQGWAFRTEHGPFFYRFYAERTCAEPEAGEDLGTDAGQASESATTT